MAQPFFELSRVSRTTKLLARELEEQPVLFSWAQTVEAFASSYPSGCDRSCQLRVSRVEAGGGDKMLLSAAVPLNLAFLMTSLLQG